jgi:monofunctional glycosyltransferase
MVRRLPPFFRRILKHLFRILGALLVLSFLATLLLRWIPPFTTAMMMERRIEAWRQNKPYKLDYRWTPLSRISPAAPLAVIAAEDQNFPTHHGFDFESIQKAIDAHEKGRKLRGASTISQQVAKNIFLWSGRSFVRKGFEVYFTMLIELTWSKHRILEVYLNIAELGEGCFGVEAASRRYFQKSAAALSSEEAASLAAILPNPIRFKVNRPSAYIQARRSWIMNQMIQLGGASCLKTF